MTTLTAAMREQAENPDKNYSHIFKVNSEALGRTVLVSELATIHVDELRALYHEVYCARQSMFKAVETLNDELQQTGLHEGESRERVEWRLKQLAKKIAVYNSFYKLIKREVTWRVSLNNVARAKIAIQAKQVGLNDAQINALLDVDSAIHKVFTIQEYSRSPDKKKAITVKDRIDSMRNEMFMAELCSILSREFDEPELADIRKEAKANIEKAVDWKQIESILTEHLPDDNGVLQL
jgi:hypothetical protein